MTSHRKLPVAANTVASHRRRVTAGDRCSSSGKDEDVHGRTASTASTCSIASFSLSNLASPSFANHRRTLYLNSEDADDDCDADSDGYDSDAGEEDDVKRRHTLSHSPPSHFTFPTALALQGSAAFSACNSAPASASPRSCFSPLSPLFDSSLSNGRHSADAQFSAGIGVFAGQLQALRRMRSANALTSPSNTALTTSLN